MKVILGLGNPGLKYRYSRHNLGYLVVDSLSKKLKIKIRQKRFGCLLGQGRINNQQLLLAKPLTFMNLSGQAVASIVKGKQVELRDLLVICDDVNLPLGKIRIRTKGGAGGHKGICSIIESLGTDSFNRLRLGVDRPSDCCSDSLQTKRIFPGTKIGRRLSNYVLGKFHKPEIKLVNAQIEQAAYACEIWISNGAETVMNQFN